MLTEPKYDQETWEEIVTRGREKIREWYPGWNDDNYSDPGITILELFSYLKEVQNFHMEQTGAAHLRKYLKLLGEKTLTRVPAKAYVILDVSRQTKLRGGTGMYAGTICFETIREQMAAGGLFLGFEGRTREGECLFSLRGEWLRDGKALSLYPFGPNPKKDSRFNVFLSEPLYSGEPYGLYLGYDQQEESRQNKVDESRYDGYGFLPPARIALQVKTRDGWQEAETEDETLGLCRSGILWFRFAGEMDKREPQLRLSLQECDYLNPPLLTRISLSMAPVLQQQTRKRLPEYRGTGFPGQRFDLEEEGLCGERFSIRVEDPVRRGSFQEWIFREDLDSSGPEDAHFTIDGSYLVFGDGFRGICPEGRIQVTRWVRTLGKAGNIKSGTITSLVNPPESVLYLTNESDAAGGRDEETPEEAFARYGSGSFRTVRAVTPEDYEQLVREAPGLAVADCRAWLSDPLYNRISVAVRPYKADGMGKLTKTMERNLYCYLEEKRLIGTRISLISPEYIFLSVACEAVGRTGYRMAGPLVEEEIRRYLSGRSFGEGISYGQFFGYLDTLSCLSQVRTLRIETWGRAVRNSVGDVMLPPNGLFILREARCLLY